MKFTCCRNAEIIDRRKTLSNLALIAVGLAPPPHQVLAEPTELRQFSTSAPPADGDVPFRTLPSGVRTKDIKEGTGELASASSTVSIQCSGRLLNLNGVAFYNTRL